VADVSEDGGDGLGVLVVMVAKRVTWFMSSL
jgi:hypothetical protein